MMGSVDFVVVNDNQQNNSSIFIQTIGNVGTATYLIGDEAITALKSSDELKSQADNFTDSGIQIIDGLSHSRSRKPVI